MTIVARTVSPRNRPSGAPAATGQPVALAPPASPAVGGVWPMRNAWIIRGQGRGRARNRRNGPAHSLAPRHGRITPVRRRRALITVSGTAPGAESRQAAPSCSKNRSRRRWPTNRRPRATRPDAIARPNASAAKPIGPLRTVGAALGAAGVWTGDPRTRAAYADRTGKAPNPTTGTAKH